jgi:hypothetical protein
MQTYITQLLSDLEASQNNQPEKVDYKLLYPNHPAASPEYEGYMDYMIEWEKAPRWRFDDLFGIKSEVFPPVDKLTVEQMTALTDGILQLWASFNIGAVILDDKIPVETVYRVLVNYWKTETVRYVSEGTLNIEFCHYDENDCPWGYDFCTCKDFTDDDLDMTIRDNSDLNTVNFDGDDLPF